MESNRVHLIPPATNCKINSDKLIRNSVPRVFTGDQSCRHSLPDSKKLQTPPKKSGVWYKQHCLQKQFRDSEPSLSVRVLGTLLKSEVTDISQPCSWSLQGSSLRPTMLTPCYTRHLPRGIKLWYISEWKRYLGSFVVYFVKKFSPFVFFPLLGDANKDFQPQAKTYSRYIKEKGKGF